jgi:hypothetical protein
MCVEFASDKSTQLNGFEAVVSVVPDRAATKAKCEAYTRTNGGCSMCTADPDCGWCHAGGGSCHAGNAVGDFDGTCAADMWGHEDCMCPPGGVVKIDLSTATASHPFVLTDGSHNGVYNPDMFCRWELYASRRSGENTSPGITLSFPQFDLDGSGASGDSSKDYLKVEWKDYKGIAKTKVFSGDSIPDPIDITGDHSEDTEDKIITVTFNSDSNDQREGFLAITKVVSQLREISDTTWSGCTCDAGKEWNHADFGTGTGCADIPDGRAICVVVPGSCGGDWPPAAPVTIFARPTECQFPFLYKDKSYDDCITSDGVAGVPWCSAFRRHPVSPRRGWKKKIPCESTYGGSDFFTEDLHYDYCSSMRHDPTGLSYEMFSREVLGSSNMGDRYRDMEQLVFEQEENGGYGGDEGGYGYGYGGYQ